jgi:hypothetical protein
MKSLSPRCHSVELIQISSQISVLQNVLDAKGVLVRPAKEKVLGTLSLGSQELKAAAKRICFMGWPPPGTI